VSGKSVTKTGDQRPKSIIVKINREELEREVREGGRRWWVLTRRKRTETWWHQTHKGRETRDGRLLRAGRVMDQLGHTVQPSTDETVWAVWITTWAARGINIPGVFPSNDDALEIP
jgi:hypothetical protein